VKVKKADRTMLSKVMMGVVLTATALAGAPAQAKEWKSVTIALEGGYAPWNLTLPGGKLGGFEPELVANLCQRIKLQCNLVAQDWDGMIPGLQAGKFDVIVNQVGVTDQRKAALDFSPAYTYSAAQLIQRKDDTRQFKTLEDLKGKKLGVGLGTNYMDMAKSVPGIDVKTYPGAPEYLRDLAAGRLDAALNDRLMLAYLLKSSQLPLRTGASVGAGNPSGIPFRKGNPKFAKAIDDAMTQLEADGTFAKISDKWFGIDVTKPLK